MLATNRLHILRTMRKKAKQQAQVNVNNFIASHLNEEATLKTQKPTIKHLAVAMNPDVFAKTFWREQGKADQALRTGDTG